jgi:hypothetical protein
MVIGTWVMGKKNELVYEENRDLELMCSSRGLHGDLFIVTASFYIATYQFLQICSAIFTKLPCCILHVLFILFFIAGRI